VLEGLIALAKDIQAAHSRGEETAPQRSGPPRYSLGQIPPGVMVAMKR
jgi:hypothetical protein